jgi:hypothetical protein
VIVTSLFVVGAFGLDGFVTSLSGVRKTTCPKSSKMTWQGACAEQVPPDVTMVSTSESSAPLNWVGLSPLAACSKSIVRNMGERPMRTTSPHDTTERTNAMTVAILFMLNP